MGQGPCFDLAVSRCQAEAYFVRKGTRTNGPEPSVRPKGYMLSIANTRRLHAATKGAHPVVASTVESLLLEERTRWAMHIHDGLTQSVTSAVLEVQTLRHRIEAEPEEAVATLREIEEALRTDLSQIRQILFELQ